MIATTGDRFSSFAPYVASVNDAGIVAFQATLRGGSTGVFLGIGDPLLGSTVRELAANPVSVSAAGHLAVRVKLVDGRQLILRADPEPTIAGG